MGKGCGMMDGKQENDKKDGIKPQQLRQEAQLRAHRLRNSGAGIEHSSEHLQETQTGNGAVSDEGNPSNLRTGDGTSRSCGLQCQVGAQQGDVSSRLVASTSSPSLLQGCSDSTTHVGAGVVKHVHSHNVQVNIMPHSPITPTPQPDFNQPSFPETDSVFLTPSPQRSRQSSERPNSAPADQLERISGTLLRLVGDHYLCSTCGRQLRTIGDQMALEANIRRTFSTSQLNYEYDPIDD